MQLSDRLESILAMAGKGEKVADIGTDHGYVPIELVRRGAYRSAIAMDVRKGPLERARNHIQTSGLSDRIETRLSDGMEKLLPGEVDTVIIAGMGGPLMSEIIERRCNVAQSVSGLILSPQTEVETFRRYLYKRHFKVEDEIWVEDENKFYVVIKASWTNKWDEDEWTETEYAYGRIPLKSRSQVLMRLLEKEIRTAEGVLSHLSSLGGESAAIRRREMQEKLRVAIDARNLMGTR